MLIFETVFPHPLHYPWVVCRPRCMCAKMNQHGEETWPNWIEKWLAPAISVTMGLNWLRKSLLISSNFYFEVTYYPTEFWAFLLTGLSNYYMSFGHQPIGRVSLVSNLVYTELKPQPPEACPHKGVPRGGSRPWGTPQVWTHLSNDRHTISLTLETNKQIG